MKLLLITNTPPVPSWGGAMTFYRHFCEREDFTIRVITDDKQVEQYKVPYTYLTVQKGKVWTRLSKTRFSRLLHTYTRLVGCLLIPAGVLPFAKDFKPDAIFTVGGSWSWMAILAKKVAKKLNIPLIASFNDWWYYNAIFSPWAEKLIEQKFRRYYKECDLAICTSAGMQKALGKHKNSIILYPTGALMKTSTDRPAEKRAGTFTVAFAGNLGEWYGKMLEALVMAARGSGIRFKIFGSNAGWSAGFDAYAKKEKFYLGQLPFNELEKEMKDVDGLLLLMGFEESCAMIEATSFKTKFLDYLSFQKPIMLWGPSYCSAVAIAGEFNSARICISSGATDFLKVIEEVRNDENLQQRLINNAHRMYEERFHPDKIHALLRTSIKALKPL